jgi:hypothetical protein
MKGFMKYSTEMGPGVMIYIQSFRHSKVNRADSQTYSMEIA